MTGNVEERAEEIGQVLIMLGSHERAAGLVDSLRFIVEHGSHGNRDLEVARRVICEFWPSIDASWDLSEDLREILLEIGYVGDRPRPTAPVQLYRGVSSRQHRRGLSWTTSIDTARKFAASYRNAWLAHKRGYGYLYTAKVPPAAVLCCFGERGEEEIVLDPYLIRNRIRFVEKVPTPRNTSDTPS